MNDKSRYLQQLKTSIQSLNFTHWLLIGLSLGLTTFAWWYSKEQTTLKNKLLFDKQANRIVHLVIERIEKYEDALWSAASKVRADRYNIPNGNQNAVFNF